MGLLRVTRWRAPRTVVRSSFIVGLVYNYRKTAFTLRAAPRSAALIDCIVINGSIHTESSDAQRCAASRIKFETRAIRAAKCRAALRVAQRCATSRSAALIMQVTCAMNINYSSHLASL